VKASLQSSPGQLGLSVDGGTSVIKPRRQLLALAIAISAGATLSACSPGADYYPAVLATPEARPDTTMNADQIKKATDDLISERDHLTSGTQSSGEASAPSPAPTTTGSVTAQPKKKKKTSDGAAQPAAGATQTAGADVKP
jgi:hypothetical protein